MFGISDPGIWLAYLLALVCLFYSLWFGITHWNKDDEESTNSCAGSFAQTLSCFTKAGVSIEYMYCFSANEKSILILRTNNREAAREVIRRQNLEYICESDLIKL